MPEPEPYILVDPSLHVPPDHDLWTGPDMVGEGNRGLFTVQSTAGCFFGMSPNWLRKHLHGLPEEFQPRRAPGGQRLFRLYDIERIAHEFAATDVISGQHLELTVKMIKACAQLHHFIA